MKRNLIFILGGVFLGVILLGLIFILRENAEVVPKQSVEETALVETTPGPGETNQIAAAYPTPPAPSPTLMRFDLTATPSITPPIDLLELKPTWTRSPTYTPRPTAIPGPVRTFEPQPVGLPENPAGEILYALRKPVDREISRNLPPYSYIYYRRVVGADGLTKGRPSRVFLPAEAVSELRLDMDPYGLYYSPS